MTTAVKDRLALDLAEVKALLFVVEDKYDVHIQLFLDAAKEAADTYLNNPFMDSTGAEYAIPTEIKKGVVELVYSDWCELNARLREELDVQAEPGQGNQPGKVLKGQAIKSIESFEKEKVEYFTPKNSKARNASPKSLEEIKRTYWASYRFVPGF